MKKRFINPKERFRFVADFETTVPFEKKSEILESTDFQCIKDIHTEVWSAAWCMLGNDDPEKVEVLTSIGAFIGKMYDMGRKIRQPFDVYFHNLKFDGSFILSFLTQYEHDGRPVFHDVTGTDKKELQQNDFKYLISDLGMWYNVQLCLYKGVTVTFLDSLKLLPMNLKTIGKSFQTKHQKLEMNYTGHTASDSSPITDEEMKYIKNDVLVLSEALSIFIYDDENYKSTIAGNCLSRYKKMTFEKPAEYRKKYPDVTKIPVDSGVNLGADFKTVDDFIRKSYHGGWCYVNKKYENKIIGYGCTADVNSLYPSVMSSQSGSRYPVGKPHVFHKYTAEIMENDRIYYFLRVRVSFTLKNNMLPFVQIKGNPMYRSTEMLEDSRPWFKGEKISRFDDGSQADIVDMVFSKTDWDLFNEHYNVKVHAFYGGYWFDTEAGIFDKYIDHYAQIKKTSKGAKRAIAKLFLNSLYGKFAAGTTSDYKVIKSHDGALEFETEEDDDQTPGYIPIGSAITSYARKFTITYAQKNYKTFCYADTDSIHCCCSPSELIDVPIHPTDFCNFKIETEWDKAKFLRQKTYVEHVIIADGEPVEPYNLIKCAGMGPGAKKNVDKLVNEKGLDVFAHGLTVGGKLQAYLVDGGTSLLDTDFTIK